MKKMIDDTLRTIWNFLCNISQVVFTCPEAVCFWSLSDVLPSVQTCLVTEGLEVLHDLSHVLDRHDDEARGAKKEEAAGSG